jgi:hypothetical protein
MSSTDDFQVRTCVVPKEVVVFPDSSTVLGGAPRPDTMGPWLVVRATRLDDSAPRCTQMCCRRSQVVTHTPNVLSSASTCFQTYDNYSNGTHVPVIRDYSYSEGWLEYPPRV